MLDRVATMKSSRGPAITNWEHLLEIEAPDNDVLNMFMSGLQDMLLEGPGPML